MKSATVSQPQPRRKRYRPGGTLLTPYLFLLPNMVIFGLFTIWPAINGFNISLYSSTTGRRFEWAGLDNYREIRSDADFRSAATNTLTYAAGFVSLSVVGSVLLAVALDAQLRGRSFFRAAFFLSVLLSPVVVALMRRWMLERRGGLINAGLQAVGLPEVPWLVDGRLAMGAVIFVGLWTHVGFYTMIALAGLQSIDGSLYEAEAVNENSALTAAGRRRPGPGYRAPARRSRGGRRWRSRRRRRRCRSRRCRGRQWAPWPGRPRRASAPGYRGRRR